MKKAKASLALSASALLLAAGAIPAQAATLVNAPDAPTEPCGECGVQAGQAGKTLKVPEAIGRFSFTQGECASASQFGTVFATAAKHLCGSDFAKSTGQDPLDWDIKVNGAVNSPICASFEKLSENGAMAPITMGCSCAGNPVDGKAAMNAEVSGLSLKALLTQAGPQEGANTIVVASSDGYSVALPLDYVLRKPSMLVFELDGQPIGNSAGGTNQLWLGSTAASFFVRDVSEITVEARQEAPTNPNSAEARASFGNLPNVGILFGGEVA